MCSKHWEENCPQKKIMKKFRKLARRAKVPVKPGRHFSREGLGKPKRFFPMPQVC